MRLQTATLSLLLTLGLAAEAETQAEIQSKPAPKCRCAPGDACWPREWQWDALGRSLGKGKLTKSSPIAESCYDGPNKDLDKCAYVNKMWTDQNFQTTKPIGRAYPYNITCVPVNYAAGETPTSCILGSLPTYAVNATTRRDISLTLDFAKRNNVRLVVASTGHDLYGRSDGYGGLEVWLRYYTNAINFQKTFKSAKRCTKSGWKGSAIHIDGAWQWGEVYKVAEANNVIAVGGGSLGPGAIGGWSSGGGHGPATHNFGMGADQILEAEVMLADGTIVTANHCQHTDLFRAIRGGGPGYGIVLSQHVKVYPNVDAVTVHKLAIAPLEQTPENKDLLDAIAVVHQQLPILRENGVAGYGFWFRNYPVAYVGDAHSGYTHGFWTIGKRQSEGEAAVAPLLEALDKFKDKLSITSTFKEYSDYWSFYHAESGLYDPVGSTSILTSRLINTEAVADYDKVREAIEIVGGNPTGVSPNVILLVSGGQVFKDAADKSSGLHPAWRVSPFVMIAGGGLPKGASREVRDYVQQEVTSVKGGALKKLAPTTGGYINEGDGSDPDFKDTFFGPNYKTHLATKKKYDANGVFYCRACVGSDAYIERPDGPLCRK